MNISLDFSTSPENVIKARTIKPKFFIAPFDDNENDTITINEYKNDDFDFSEPETPYVDIEEEIDKYEQNMSKTIEKESEQKIRLITPDSDVEINTNVYSGQCTVKVDGIETDKVDVLSACIQSIDKSSKEPKEELVVLQDKNEEAEEDENQTYDVSSHEEEHPEEEPLDEVLIEKASYKEQMLRTCEIIAKQYYDTKDIQILFSFFQSNDIMYFDFITEALRNHGALDIPTVVLLTIEPLFTQKMRPIFLSMLGQIDTKEKVDIIENLFQISQSVTEYLPKHRITITSIKDVMQSIEDLKTLASLHKYKEYVDKYITHKQDDNLNVSNIITPNKLTALRYMVINEDQKSFSAPVSPPQKRVARFNGGVFEKIINDNVKDTKLRKLLENAFEAELRIIKNENEKMRANETRFESIYRENQKVAQENCYLQEKYSNLESSYTYIKDQFENVVAQNHDLKNKITELENSNQLFIKTTEEFREKIRFLEQELERSKNIQMDNVLSYFNSYLPPYASPVGWSFFKEMFINFHHEPRGRMHSNDIKKFAFLLYNYSPSAYKALQAHFPYPSYNTFSKLLSNTEEDMKAMFLDEKKIQDYLKNTFDKNFPCNGIPHRVNLAIDAIAIQPEFLPHFKREMGSIKLRNAAGSQINYTSDHLAGKKQEKFEAALQAQPGTDEAKPAIINSAFIFYIQPLDPSLPCFPVHIHLKSGGSADSVIRDKTKEIIYLIESTNILDICTISTDGDSGHNLIYDLVVDELMKLSPTLDIDALLRNEKRFDIKHMGAADLLHLFKTLRVRFLKYDIDIYPTFPSSIMNANETKSQLKPGKELEDLSQIGKMRDVYAINFFTFENLKRLIEKKNKKAILIFTPFVFWARAVFDTVLDMDSRINMLKIAFEIIKRFSNILTAVKGQNWNGTLQKNYKNKATALTISTESVFRRMLSTLYVLISELSDWRDSRSHETWIYTSEKARLKFAQLQRMRNLGIERYGTHPLENFNGYIRDQSCSKDTAATLQSICAKGQIMKSITIDLSMSTCKRSRANAGGLKVSEFLSIAPDFDFNPVVIADTLFAICGFVNEYVMLGNVIDDDQVNELFRCVIETNSISNLAFVQKIKISVRSNCANSRVNARNVMFSII